MSEGEKLARLVEISMFTLGYLIGREGIEDPAAISMARVLKSVGVESSYVNHICERANQAESRRILEGINKA